jgi:hypothetical protein
MTLPCQLGGISMGARLETKEGDSAFVEMENARKQSPAQKLSLRVFLVRQITFSDRNS